MLASIRKAINISDVHMENPNLPGVHRHYEAEIIRKACPTYLKTGGSVALTMDTIQH